MKLRIIFSAINYRMVLIVIETLVIYFFYDMPHLIKLCRNAIFNYGFILPDGTKLDQTTFKAIENVVDAGGEIFGAFKISSFIL